MFSVGFNVVQYIFIKGYTGEIERDKICCNNKSYSIDEKKNKLTLPTYENIMQKPISLVISCLYRFERDPWTHKKNKLQSLNTCA